MKKILFLLTLFVSGVCAFAQSFVVDGLTYTIDENHPGEVSLTNGSGSSGDLEIPANVEYEGVNYSVTSIGGSAFFGCSGLRTIILPQSVASISYGSFYGCDRLRVVVCEADTPPAYEGREIIDAVLYVPYGKKEIYSQSDNWNYGLLGIFEGIPDEINKTFTIDNGVFYVPYSETEALACSADASITEAAIKPEVAVNGKQYQVNILPQASFMYCGLLESVTIPEGVTSIGWKSFSGCSSLTSLTIPSSVTSIGWGAFLASDRLKVIVCKADTPPAYLGGTSGMSNLEVTEAVLYVPSGRKEIYSQTDGWKDDFRCIFDGIPEETYIVENNIMYAPYSETQAWAYSTDVSITDAVIKPEVIINGKQYTVDLLPYSSFRNCTELKSVSIPNSVTSIGDFAFYGCSALTSLIIPDSVTSIGDSVFKGCSALTSLTIPDSVTSIGEDAFYECSGLTSLSISNSLTEIKVGVFFGCSSLTSVTIPNSVTKIGANAFFGCSALTSVTLSNNLTDIDMCAFKDCPSLIEIESLNPVPPTCNSRLGGVFDTEIYENATLKVPVNSLADYQNAAVWKKFYNIEEVDFSGVGEIVADDDLNSRVELYNIGGRKVYEGVELDINSAGLTPGVYIVRSGKGAARKITVK